MSDPRSPYIVRPAPPVYFVKPGFHSHNANRRSPVREAFSALHGVRLVLLLFGLAALGYYGYTLSDEYVYQNYQNWAFDQQIAGRAHVTFADYIRERTPFGFVVGSKAPAPNAVSKPETNSPPMPEVPRPEEGSVLGRVEIARLNLAAVVREGVDTKVLSVAVGHVPSTALPGQPGNFAIAAHRDTLFRGLKDIRRGDLVSFQSPVGTYTYQVIATKIVRPSDVTVLQPDGGGLIAQTQPVNGNGQPSKLLTMITCYPFYYVGSAPKRFIVEAELVGNAGDKTAPPPQANDASPPPPSTSAVSSAATRGNSALQSKLTKPRYARGSSRSDNLRPRATSTDSSKQKVRKRGFWHRVFHVS